MRPWRVKTKSLGRRPRRLPRRLPRRWPRRGLSLGRRPLLSRKPMTALCQTTLTPTRISLSGLRWERLIFANISKELHISYNISFIYHRIITVIMCLFWKFYMRFVNSLFISTILFNQISPFPPFIHMYVSMIDVLKRDREIESRRKKMVIGNFNCW